jgi:hypothetical protein
MKGVWLKGHALFVYARLTLNKSFADGCTCFLLTQIYYRSKKIFG